MRIKITCRHDSNQIRKILKEAKKFTLGRTNVKLPPGFQVWVKNSSNAHAGTYFGHKITLRIGKENKFPHKFKYPRLKSAPEYILENWQEALFSVACHEMWHHVQRKTNSPFSEIETETVSLNGLTYFRENREKILK